MHCLRRSRSANCLAAANKGTLGIVLAPAHPVTQSPVARQHRRVRAVRRAPLGHGRRRARQLSSGVPPAMPCLEMREPNCDLAACETSTPGMLTHVPYSANQKDCLLFPAGLPAKEAAMPASIDSLVGGEGNVRRSSHAFQRMELLWHAVLGDHSEEPGGPRRQSSIDCGGEGTARQPLPSLDCGD